MSYGTVLQLRDGKLVQKSISFLFCFQPRGAVKDLLIVRHIKEQWTKNKNKVDVYFFLFFSIQRSGTYGILIRVQTAQTVHVCFRFKYFSVISVMLVFDLNFICNHKYPPRIHSSSLGRKLKFMKQSEAKSRAAARWRKCETSIYASKNMTHIMNKIQDRHVGVVRLK